MPVFFGGCSVNYILNAGRFVHNSAMPIAGALYNIFDTLGEGKFLPCFFYSLLIFALEHSVDGQKKSCLSK